MELIVGEVYSMGDLAQWFGVNQNTLTRNKDKYFSRLSEFIEWEPFGKKKIKVTKVIEAEYSKEKFNNYTKIKNTFEDYWDESGLDSCKRVADEIYNSQEFPLTEATTYNYVLRGKAEEYGKPFISEGNKGTSKYIWCKRREDGRLDFLTPQEQEVKENIIKKYYGDITEKAIIVKGMVEVGEIKKEEAWEILEGLSDLNNRDRFMNFLMDLREAIGCEVVKGTLLIKKEEGVNFIENK